MKKNNRSVKAVIICIIGFLLSFSLAFANDDNYCFDRNGKEAKKEQLETARSPFSLDEIVAEIGQKSVPKTYEFVPKLAQ